MTLPAHLRRPVKVRDPRLLARVATLLTPHHTDTTRVEPVAAPDAGGVHHHPLNQGTGQGVPPRRTTTRPRISEPLTRVKARHELPGAGAVQDTLKAGHLSLQHGDSPDVPVTARQTRRVVHVKLGPTTTHPLKLSDHRGRMGGEERVA